MAPYADVETLLSDWLKTQLGFANVVHELPTNLMFVMPLVVVERFGGTDNVITLDIARVDIDVFCPDRATAKANAEKIRTAMRWQLPGYVANGTTVARVETLSAPSIAPFDSRNSIRRASASYQVRLHQFTGVS